jgi:hypothetical protein
MRGELRGIGKQIDHHQAQRYGVPPAGARHTVADLEAELQTFLPGVLRNYFHRAGHQFMAVNGDHLRLHPPRVEALHELPVHAGMLMGPLRHLQFQAVQGKHPVAAIERQAQFVIAPAGHPDPVVLSL